VIGLVTDSNAQLPAELVDRYGIEVVPLTVTVDGVDHLEGVDLDADAFYAAFAEGRTPQVSTSQPSPGRFAATYRRLAEAGAEEIVSIHIGSAVSGTVNSARLAAGAGPVPVRVVDSGTASFGVGCCTWEAAEALRAGASADEAAAAAEALAPRIGNVFVVGALDLVRAGGRLAAGAEAGAGVPVLSLVDGAVQVVGTAADVEEASTVMAERVRAHGTELRVAIGIADAAGAPFWQGLEAALAGAPEVVEVVRYRVGPSIGAHTGPGTAGAFFYPSSASSTASSSTPR
jgi:DegV family protein with EDD domain